MEPEAVQFLKLLLETPSPSGFEEQVQDLYLNWIKAQVSKSYKDVHGNAFGVVNPGGKVKVMLSGHCDEVGLMVKYIDDQGYIYFSSVGGIDPQITQGMRVTIVGASGLVPGVIGKKPIHLQEQEERNKVVKLDGQWIDIGASNREQALKVVQVGDPVVINLGFQELLEQRVAARGIDDRIGTFVVAEVLKKVDSAKLQCAVFGVSTVQEELGLRGAKTSAFGIKPQIGIAIDLTFSADCPEVNKKMVGDISLGKGPVIARGPNINPLLYRRLVQVAEEHNLPYQVQAESRATGTDANVIQITREGVATGLVSIPSRYMHSPSEIIDLQDVENAISLLVFLLESLSPEENWIP